MCYLFNYRCKLHHAQEKTEVSTFSLPKGYSPRFSTITIFECSPFVSSLDGSNSPSTKKAQICRECLGLNMLMCVWVYVKNQHILPPNLWRNYRISSESDKKMINPSTKDQAPCADLSEILLGGFSRCAEGLLQWQEIW